MYQGDILCSKPISIWLYLTDPLPHSCPSPCFWRFKVLYNLYGYYYAHCAHMRLERGGSWWTESPTDDQWEHADLIHHVFLCAEAQEHLYPWVRDCVSSLKPTLPQCISRLLVSTAGVEQIRGGLRRWPRWLMDSAVVALLLLTPNIYHRFCCLYVFDVVK